MRKGLFFSCRRQKERALTIKTKEVNVKKLMLILTILCLCCRSLVWAGSYYEIEEWESDAVSVSHTRTHGYDRVYYYDSYGRRVYTTRYAAERRGLSPYRRDTLLLPGGKYRREVRREEKKGILTTILEILL